MHRIKVTKIELFRYGTQSDDDPMYCEKDSINHNFTDCVFVKAFHKSLSAGSM